MEQTCHDGGCSKCWGAKYIIVGIIVLLTAINWLEYIWHVLGALLIFKGIMKLAMPMCGHCQPSEMKKGRK